MSDLNAPGHENGIQGDEPPVDEEAAPTPDDEDGEPGGMGLGRTPMPPD